jgi:hypothetical protein
MVHSNTGKVSAASLRCKGREVNSACKIIHAIAKHSGAGESLRLHAALPRMAGADSFPLFAKYQS